MVLRNSQLPLKISLVQFCFGSCEILEAFVGVAICVVFWANPLRLIALETESSAGLSAFSSAHHPRHRGPLRLLGRLILQSLVLP